MLKKIRLGELLVENKVISTTQLEVALKRQQERGGKFGRVLMELGYIDESRLLNFLSQQLHIPFLDIRYYQLKPQIIRRLPETLSRRFRCLVVDEIRGSYLLGMSDPTDLFAVDEVSRVLQSPLRICAVRESDLLNVIDEVYRRTEDIANFAVELQEELGVQQEVTGDSDVSEDSQEAPVVKLLDSIFGDAVQVNASDIHIEPDESVLRIRQRVDGVLHEHVMNEKRIASALVSRLKLMAKLNISEKRLPQDGRFRLKVKEKQIDVRLSTMPVQYGESVVMRILDGSAGVLQLEQLGMPPEVLDPFRKQLHRPYGLILVTGPTGSGKTTTLYAALSELNTPENKIITAEDPIEYALPRINQVQVKPKIGLNFADILRSALRQDPDIILVGEMRDEETAQIGLRASITGHLVLSTLHTNDAISSAVRLMDMNVPGYMVASALRAIIAQRLVRRICETCIDEYEPSVQEKSWLASVLGEKAALVKLMQGKGCHRCGNTGYRGRIGVYELLVMNQAMVDAMRSGDAQLFGRVAAADPTYKNLATATLEYALKGMTTLTEVFRVAGEFSEEEGRSGSSAKN